MALQGYPDLGVFFLLPAEISAPSWLGHHESSEGPVLLSVDLVWGNRGPAVAMEGHRSLSKDMRGSGASLPVRKFPFMCPRSAGAFSVEVVRPGRPMKPFGGRRNFRVAPTWFGRRVLPRMRLAGVVSGAGRSHLAQRVLCGAVSDFRFGRTWTQRGRRTAESEAWFVVRSANPGSGTRSCSSCRPTPTMPTTTGRLQRVCL